ncbi:MAG: Nif3-like dinuclear metal center hexameric protein [Bacteroidales bacterium]|nr:Nif3-like dinuclear metal center hexameric protein [Bacteroidales bacterium]
MKIKDITACIEAFAPLKTQESYDNSGLIIGHPESGTERALICLDVTEAVINEAIEKQCDLIISHHPLIFGGIKKINGFSMNERIIIKAIQEKIAIYAAHTNLDAAYNGVNHILAERLGVKNLSLLQPAKDQLKKLVVFCPTDHAEKVRDALFLAGAGHIGNYDSCSFNIDGTGTFRARGNAKPFVGKLDELHREEEIRIETIFPFYLQPRVVQAMLKAHPYEEVAYDIYSLDNLNPLNGIGVVGELDEALAWEEWVQIVKKNLMLEGIKHSPKIKNNVKRIALCGGSGSFLIPSAIAANADVFLTADLKYHSFFEAENRIMLIDAGHYETEQFAKELLFRVVKEKFTTFAVLISATDTNPVRYA